MKTKQFKAMVLALLTGAFMLATGCDERSGSSETTSTSSSEGSSAAPSVEEPAKKAPEAKAKSVYDGLEPRKSDPLMWVYEGPNGPTYLVGSVHIGVSIDKHLPPVVLKALDRSKRFASEADVMSASGAIAARSALPDGRTLKDELGEETYAKLEKLMGGNMHSYRRFKPFFIVSTLAPLLMPEGSDLGMMDVFLEQRAQMHNQEIGYLESAELQLDLLEESMSAEVLKEMIDDFDNQKVVMKDMLVSYLKGDIEALEKSFDEQAQAADATRYEALLYKRNENWIPTLKKIADAGDGFVVFGAAHAFGDRGVLELMKKEGYTFERVKNGQEIPPKK